MEKIEMVLTGKISKNTFFQGLFERLKKAWKKSVFCNFKDHFDFLMFKLFSKILTRYTVFYRLNNNSQMAFVLSLHLESLASPSSFNQP
eukprot:UN24276